MGVDDLPVVVGHQMRLPFGQPGDEVVGVVGADVTQRRARQIGDERLDGVRGVLLVGPDHPEGPRLIQPTTYSLARPVIRPSSCGMVPAPSLNGRPGTGTPR